MATNTRKTSNCENVVKIMPRHGDDVACSGCRASHK